MKTQPKMKSRLGIIGGLGAAAGVMFAQRIVDLAQRAGADKDEDFPDFLLYNLPATGMDRFGFTNRDEIETQLVEAMDLLMRCECEVALIACNTVQIFHTKLQQQFPEIDLVNMIEAGCDKAKGCERVGVLCSETTKRLGLYDAELAKRDIRIVNTTNVEQKCLDDAIGAVMGGRHGIGHVQTVNNVLNILCGRGAEKVIIGCTELSLLLDRQDKSNYCIDAGYCALVRALSLL